jgi:hypothetical protein
MLSIRLTDLVLVVALLLSTFHFPLSTFCLISPLPFLLLSTFHFPLSTLHSPLSALFPLSPFCFCPVLTHAQYEVLERAIAHRHRIAVTRQGTEYVVVPDRLSVITGREMLDARHPTTGERMTLALDDLSAVELVATR